MSQPPFSTTTPNFRSTALQGCSSNVDSKIKTFHEPFFHTAPFGTTLLCSNISNNKRCSWAMSAQKFVNQFHCASPSCYYFELLQAISSSPIDKSSLVNPLPVMVAEQCVSSMMQAIDDFSGSSFALATSREKYTRIRLSISKRDNFLAENNNNNNNTEHDDYILILWCLDPALATTAFLINLFDERFPISLKLKATRLLRKQNTHTSNFNHQDLQNMNSGNSGGDPENSSNDCATLLGFPLDCFEEIEETIRNVFFPTTSTKCQEDENQDFDGNDIGMMIVNPAASNSNSTSGGDSSATSWWMFDSVPKSTLCFFKNQNLNKFSIIDKKKQIESYLDQRILTCTCPREINNRANRAVLCCEFCKIPLWRHLLPHQRKSVIFALLHDFRCLLASAMGCGKTLEAIALIRLLFLKHSSQCQNNSERPNFRPLNVVIVCPATARNHWADSLEQWLGACGCYGEHVCEIHIVTDGASAPKDDVIDDDDDDLIDEKGEDDSTKNDATTFFKKKYNITITSFSMLTRLFSSHFEHRDFDLVIIDESHIIRANALGSSNANPDDTNSNSHLSSQQAVSCAKLVQKNEHQKFLFLSGTPLLSKPFDCFAQVDLLHPGLLGSSPQEFASNYLVIQFQPFIHPGSCHRSEELRYLLSDAVMIRNEKSDVLAMMQEERHRKRSLQGEGRIDNNSNDGDDDVTDSLNQELIRQIWRLEISKPSAPQAANVEPLNTSESDDDSDTDDGEEITTENNNAPTPSISIPKKVTRGRVSHQKKYQEIGLSKVSEALNLCIRKIVTPERDNSVNNGCLRIVLFAHHVAVLNNLAALIGNLQLEEQSKQYDDNMRNEINGGNDQEDFRPVRYSVTRIDGSVLPEDRHWQIKKFHESDDENDSATGKKDMTEIKTKRNTTLLVKFALVSMTAAGVAISLHKARLAVFVELPPDATWLRQCEDRLHRMSSSSSSNEKTKNVQSSIKSYLCVDKSSIFDAKHVAQLFASLESVAEVYHHYQQHIKHSNDSEHHKDNETVGDAAIVTNTTSQSTKKSKFFLNTSKEKLHEQELQQKQNEIEKELVVALMFQVNMSTSRVHFFRRDTESLFNCSFDQIYNSQTFTSKNKKIQFLVRNFFPASTSTAAFDAISTKIGELAVEFMSLWNKHLRPASKRVAPAFTLSQFRLKVQEANNGFVNLVANSSSAFHPRQGIFDRYLGKRLSEMEVRAWCSQKSICDGQTEDDADSAKKEKIFLVATMIYNRVAFLLPTKTSANDNSNSNEKNGKKSNLKKQTTKPDQIDLLLEVTHGGEDISVFCLNCRDRLPCQAHKNPARFALVSKLREATKNSGGFDSTAMIVVDATKDIKNSEWIPFCSGECRNSWMMKRALIIIPTAKNTGNTQDQNVQVDFQVSRNFPNGGVGASSRLRRAVVKTEKGVCASCNIDTREVIRKLSSIPSSSIEKRFELLQDEYPLIFTVPGGFAAAWRLCAKPTEGNIWNADHIVPVCMGGGASAPSDGNIQTLCVACHLAKSAYERASLVGIRNRDKVDLSDSADEEEAEDHDEDETLTVKATQEKSKKILAGTKSLPKRRGRN